MLGRRETLFLTPYFQFEKRFDFLVINTHDDLLCLPSWQHGKQGKMSWKNHGILLCDFCGNPDVMFSGVWDDLHEQLDLSSHTLVPVSTNLVDEIWDGRPPRPNKPILPLSLQFTGLCGIMNDSVVVLEKIDSDSFVLLCGVTK